MPDTDFSYPFPSINASPICDSGVCPSSTPNPSSSSIYCGGSLVNNASGCVPCSFEDDNGFSSISFLGCNVLGFNGKLGYNGSESSVTIDLAASGETDNSTCEQFTDSYGNVHNCFNYNSCSPDPSAPPNTYNGSLGNIYTFSIGTFCFRGILIDHQYIESDNGFRYRVTLSDGRQVLTGVSVILNDLYINPPEELWPNLINILYEIESSVGDETCVSGNKCEDFGKSGDTLNKGMFLKKALEAINGKICQIPITKACLSMDLQKIIDITPELSRVTSSEANVLELITLACEEAGYDFYVEIVGYSIVAKPVNNKNTTITDNSAIDAPLFQLLSDLSSNYVTIDREYGQEMTFNHSKKLVFGDHIKYLTIIDENTIFNDPGSILAKNSQDANDVPLCSPTP